MKWRVSLTLALIVALIAVASTVKVRLIQEFANDAQLLWNRNEALLFIGTTKTGRRQTMVELAFEVLANYYGGATEPDDTRRAVRVIRYSRDRLEERVLRDVPVSSYTVVDGKVYDLAGNRWSGSKFETATESEAEEFYARMRGYDQFHPNQGWAYRNGLLTRPEIETRIPINIAGETADLVVQRSGRQKWIELRREGRATKEVWRLDESPHVVSESRYRNYFSDSTP